MVQRLVSLMNTAEEFTGPVNLGSPSEFTITIIHQALPSDDPRQRQPDIALARQRLGLRPTTPLEKGLSKTIACFDEVLRCHSRHDAGA